VVFILAVLISTLSDVNEQEKLVTAATGLLAGIFLVSSILFAVYGFMLNRQLSRARSGLSSGTGSSTGTTTGTNTSTSSSSSSTTGTRGRQMTAVQKMFWAGQLFSFCFMAQSILDFITTFTLSDFDRTALALSSLHFFFDIIAVFT